MANSEEKLLKEFESKMKRLMLYCDLLKSENGNLKREVSQKDATIKQLTETNEQLEKQYNNLKFANAFASDNTEEVQVAKNRLSKLVQDVDKCIGMLKS